MDTIVENGASSTATADKIVLGAGILSTDVSITRDDNDLLINFSNGTDQIRIPNWYSSATYQIESLEFADGTVYDVNTLNTMGLEVHGTAGDDIMNGIVNENDILYGEGGNDTLYGGTGSDQLFGGAGDDILGGGSSSTGYYSYTYDAGVYRADSFTGGTGNDTLNGNYYADTYYFNNGDGMDTIVENGASSTATADRVVLGAGLNTLDIIFNQIDNDLVISINGSMDSVNIDDWYLGSTNQIEEITAGDGSSLTNTQVEQLIQAMATFSAENGGISWEQAIQDRSTDVEAILAAYWQPSA